MGTKTIRTSKHAHKLDFIGGHLAIDFVTTVRVVGGEVTDTLQSDGDVKDRTKGDGRRFCTSAGCGNRAKAAAYRCRTREQAGD